MPERTRILSESPTRRRSDENPQRRLGRNHRSVFPPHREWSEENNKEAREILESGDYEKLMEYIDEEDSTVPWFLCPICTMAVISEGDMKSYLKKVTGVTESEAFEEIKKENRRRRKLYDSEYNSYAARKLGRPITEIEKEIVAKFSPDYERFLKFLSE